MEKKVENSSRPKIRIFFSLFNIKHCSAKCKYNTNAVCRETFNITRLQDQNVTCHALLLSQWQT